MPRKKREATVRDGYGVALRTGDTVTSLRKFDRAQVHIGTVAEIDYSRGLIVVEHRTTKNARTTCCEPGRCSQSDPSLWTRRIERPTAWEKLLSDDGL